MLTDRDRRVQANLRLVRQQREARETALTLIEERGETNALAWANHCAARSNDGFWHWVARFIEHWDDPQ